MPSFHKPMASRPASNACAVDGFDCFIGVEFEYLVPYIPPGKADPDPVDKRYVVRDDVETRNGEGEMTRELAAALANTRLHREFREAGLPAVVDSVVNSKIKEMEDDDEIEARRDRYFAKQAAEQGVPIPRDGSAVEHRFWRLNTDLSVKHDKNNTDCMGRERYLWALPHKSMGFDEKLGLELASPVLRASEAADAISAALHTLRRSLRFVVPRSAGLHVHLSSLEGGVDLLTVKKMVSLVLLCEGVIYTMANPWRLKSKFSASVMSALVTVQEDRETRSRTLGETGRELAVIEADRNRRLETMHEHLPWPLRPSEKRHDALETLWTCAGHDELRMLHSGMAVKRKADRPTEEDPDAGLYTIEMRQFEGTVDPDTTCAWVRFCAALFRIASTGDAASYKAKMTELNNLLSHRYDNPASAFTMYTCKLEAFMQAIGLADAAQFWRRKSDRDKVIPTLSQTCMTPTRLIPPLIW